MHKPAVHPPEIMTSVYGPCPKERAVDLLDLVSVDVGDLFPDVAERIYVQGDDVSVIANATSGALSKVDMSMIKPGDSVNVLSSEHGYSIIGGEPYVRMLEALTGEIQTRTGCKDVRLMVGAYKGFRESDEFIKHYEKLGTYKKVADVFGIHPNIVYRVIKNRVHRKDWNTGQYITVKYDKNITDYYTENTQYTKRKRDDKGRFTKED